MQKEVTNALFMFASNKIVFQQLFIVFQFISCCYCCCCSLNTIANGRKKQNEIKGMKNEGKQEKEFKLLPSSHHIHIHICICGHSNDQNLVNSVSEDFQFLSYEGCYLYLYTQDSENYSSFPEYKVARNRLNKTGEIFEQMQADVQDAITI